MTLVHHRLFVEFLQKLYEGKTRRGGLSTFTHLHRVATSLSRFQCDITSICGYCHDAEEDGLITLEALLAKLKELGANDEALATIAVVLRLLNHDEAIPYMTYIKGLLGNQIAVRVKVADLCDNLCDQPGTKRPVYLAALGMLTSPTPLVEEWVPCVDDIVQVSTIKIPGGGQIAAIDGQFISVRYHAGGPCHTHFKRELTFIRRPEPNV